MTELYFKDIWYWFIVMAVVSYFVGCFNFALLISKIKHKDVRKMGSGNPGTMNMSRQFGLKIGALTLFLDMVKGGIPLLVAYFIFRGKVFAGTDVLISDLARYVCGVSVIVGHIYPVTMKFKGGKGIASTLGMYAFALCCEESVDDLRRAGGPCADPLLYLGERVGLDRVSARRFAVGGRAGLRILFPLCGRARERDL